MNHFRYVGDDLWCEDVPLSRIAGEVGTPTYVYSSATLTRHYQVFDAALAGLDHLICYSVKANSNLAVLKLLFDLGAGADVVSGGELFRALRAGVDPSKVVFSGVGKTEPEIRMALDAGIRAFNVESRDELHAIARVAAAAGARAPVALRVNPDVDAETHPYISTGLQKNKFGIPMPRARDVYREARDLPSIDIVGIDCHIGSQLTKTSPFADAIARLRELVVALRDDGIAIRSVDIGGGLGIPYREETDLPSPADYGAAVAGALAPLADLGLTVLCEPGRVIAGNAGVLLTRVLYHKSTDVKNFVIVDAAFNDLLRPAFYDAYHAIKPVRRRGDADTWVADVVGPICETGDFLARDRSLPRTHNGDLLAVMSAGAYGFVMASNYNSRPRAAEVLVRGDRFAVVRARETLEQLVAGETIPDW
ncbi:MAG: diaminopimelate decarboxylase [Deltaproteobacteria bacterium]|nr:MAG: diaminopimelate decarboxylase [Deltaproteobacteria bacterium]